MPPGRFRASESILLEGDIEGVEYAGRRIDQFVTVGATLTNCTFSETAIAHVQFGSGTKQTIFRDCRFSAVCLNMDVGGNCRYERCVFERATFRSWMCMAVELIDCRFTGEIEDSILSAAVPPSLAAMVGRNTNELRRNDFSRASLKNTVFRGGVDLLDQSLPSGPGCILIREPVAVLRAAKAALHEQAEGQRKDAAALHAVFGMWEMELELGQRQLWVQRSDLDAIVGDVVAGNLWDALAAANGTSS